MGDEDSQDLSSFLAERRDDVEHLIEQYFETDLVQRGGFVKLVVNRLANLDAARSEVLRPVLRELDGGSELLERFDKSHRDRVDVLAQLDELSTGVGARDVHQHQPERIAALMGELGDKVAAYDRYEQEELVPFVSHKVGPERLGGLGRQASQAAQRHLTHTRPNKAPADERSALAKMFSALHDWLRDESSHPKDVIEGKGEQGP